MKHWHHKIPKHMGGTDEPSNLIIVTPEEHAELHLALYLEHGLMGDWLAFHTLSGQINLSEASTQAWLEGAARGGATQGRINAQSGHLKRIGQIRNLEGERRGGEAAVKSGQLAAARERNQRQRLERGERKYNTIVALLEAGYDKNHIQNELSMSRNVVNYYLREYSK